MENALNVMKDLVSEFITEQENEDKLNNEIDILLDGIDFSKPMDGIDCSQFEVSVTFVLFLFFIIFYFLTIEHCLIVLKILFRQWKYKKMYLSALQKKCQIQYQFYNLLHLQKKRVYQLFQFLM